MATAQIAAVLAVLASLWLVTRGFRSHSLSLARTWKFAAIWALIILLVALIISRMAL